MCVSQMRQIRYTVRYECFFLVTVRKLLYLNEQRDRNDELVAIALLDDRHLRALLHEIPDDAQIEDEADRRDEQPVVRVQLNDGSLSGRLPREKKITLDGWIHSIGGMSMGLQKSWPLGTPNNINQRK